MTLGGDCYDDGHLLRSARLSWHNLERFRLRADVRVLSAPNTARLAARAGGQQVQLPDRTRRRIAGRARRSPRCVVRG